MRALIAGGGITGLATGIALRKAGHDVEVFERTPGLREIGAALPASGVHSGHTC